MEKINALGVGAQGLGGLTTVLDVKVLDYPCHAANLPVALVPNCAATRHCHFHLDGSGPAKLEAAQAGRLAGRHLDAGSQVRHPGRT
jgi:fumarate hydratase class I